MAAVPVSLAPPRLEHFVITQKLGQGTYATVYKAFRKGNNRDVVAIKCIQMKTLSKPAIENLLVEIELLKKLDHEHIVKLKDFQWNEHYIFLIMEYCSGGDLSGFIQSKRALPEDIARKFLRQLALALHFLHSKKISHFDLKPQNLLLSSKVNPVLKLADFGFAQHFHGDAQSNSLRGSPLYMAPEMFCSFTYDSSVDLWSVGVILYETLFGFAPFASRTFAELETKIRSSESITLPSSARVSPDCRDLLLGLLQRDPKQRMSFRAFFEHRFIDVEHAPSPQCLEKAVNLVTEAVKCDQSSNFKLAARLYCQALDFFLPALDYENDPVRKAKLREKITEYLNRAEELKQYLKTNSPEAGGARTSPPDELLAHYAKDNPQLKDALHLAEVAKIRDDHEVYDGALEQYEKALASLLPLLSAAPKGELRDTLRQQVERYMKRAEEINLYLKISKERSQVPSEAEMVDQTKSCCVQ